MEQFELEETLMITSFHSLPWAGTPSSSPGCSRSIQSGLEGTILYKSHYIFLHNSLASSQVHNQTPNFSLLFFPFSFCCYSPGWAMWNCDSCHLTTLKGTDFLMEIEYERLDSVGKFQIDKFSEWISPNLVAYNICMY